MALLVTDPDMQDRLLAERRAMGGDRFDEVWEGIYVMAPIADNVHQDLQGGLTAVLKIVTGFDPQAKVLPGANISDLEEQWEHNYRCPDVAVFLPGTSARDCRTHWLGGPDFAVEILSRGDRTPQKIPFYASVNVRELLVVGRDPWSIELYRLASGELLSIGRSTPGMGDALESQVLPATFRLLSGQRPQIEVTHRVNGQRWTV